MRGLQCLTQADVVIYDHLIHPRLVGMARPNAERIDVGMPAPHALEQEAICYLLAEKAREGKAVARLKWGDPFVFGHGGAEALFLHEQGVRFEVVPGVPAAIGAAAYAGIPLTYPGGGDTLTFVREHDDEDRTRASVDWASLGRRDGTIVCHAGPDRLPAMLKALTSHGRPLDDPAALIYNGTLPTQETVVGTLGEMSERLRHTEDRRAAILVVGRVTALREHLQWFDSRPLFGKRVLITRPRGEAAEFVALLEALGAQPVEAPLIAIAPPEDWGPLDEAVRHCGRFDWIVFSSRHAVDAFLARLLASPLDLRALGGVKLCAVGPATAEHLQRAGLKVDLVPTESGAESAAQALVASGPMAGAHVLLPRADIGREVIAEELRRRGTHVTEVVAYRTVEVDHERPDSPDIYRMLLDRQIDVVTFTSPSAVRSLVELLGAEQTADLLKPAVVASIGPVTANAAARLNIETSVMPLQSTIPALVDAIRTYFERPPT